MWLMPCSRITSSVRSASALETSPSAAAPKITRLDSCPVAPKGARSIIPESLRERLRLAGAARCDAGRLVGLLRVDGRPRRVHQAVRPVARVELQQGLQRLRCVVDGRPRI